MNRAIIKEVIAVNLNEINVLVLAYLGDAIYEYYIRAYLISQKIGNVNNLQKKAIDYVSAISQAKYVTKMLEEGLLSEEEINIVKRARNYKTTSHPKNCDIITYKYATGLEALIGYLNLNHKQERIDEIMNFILV